MLSHKETALKEALRVQKHGFTGSELERTKTWLIRRIEKSYHEHNKTESGRYASEYLRNFFENEPIPGIAYEYNAVRELAPKISLDEVNMLAEQWLSEKEQGLFAKCA